MAQNLTPALRLAFIKGEVVSYEDMLTEQSANRAQIGRAIFAQQGLFDALPAAPANPLSVTVTGAMQISAGGVGQMALVQGFFCDGCPASSAFNVADAPGSGTRVDLLAVQYATVDVGVVSRDWKNADGDVSSTNVDQVNDGVIYQYVQGDGSGAVPATPTGWSAFAKIVVPAGTVSLTEDNIVYLMPTMNSQGIQGIQGVKGDTGASIPPYTQTTADATVPAVNSPVTLAATSGLALAAGAYVSCFSADLSVRFYGQVTGGALSAAPVITCSKIEAGTAGATLPAGSTIMLSGSAGPKGDKGDAGAGGSAGADGADGASVTPRGGWSVSTGYNRLDLVTYSGSSYIATAVSVGSQPDTDGGVHWQLIASKGAKGDTGSAGSNGSNGSNGSTGPQGPAPWVLTTAPVAVPNVGDITAFPFAGNGGAMAFGAFVIVSDGSSAIHGQITAGGTSPLSIKCLQILAAGDGTIDAGATITFTGPQFLPQRGRVNVSVSGGGNRGSTPVTFASPIPGGYTVALTCVNDGAATKNDGGMTAIASAKTDNGFTVGISTVDTHGGTVGVDWIAIPN